MPISENPKNNKYYTQSYFIHHQATTYKITLGVVFIKKAIAALEDFGRLVRFWVCDPGFRVFTGRCGRDLGPQKSRRIGGKLPKLSRAVTFERRRHPDTSPVSTSDGWSSPETSGHCTGRSPRNRLLFWPPKSCSPRPVSSSLAREPQFCRFSAILPISGHTGCLETLRTRFWPPKE